MIDRSMADYNVSLKTGTYYFRIFWYVFTAMLANMRIITLNMVEQSREQWKRMNKKDPWEKYLKGNSYGWFDWMLDTGLAIAEKGILMDWPDISDDTQRPKWMRKRFLPCSCKRCFFCKNHLTGRYGPPKKSPTKKAATQSNFVTPAKRSRSAKRSSTPALTKKAKRGRIEEVAADHVKKAVKIFDYVVNCGVCVEEGRIRKPKGVPRENTHISKCIMGCPHLNCREHPVCKEHWKKFNKHHSWSNIR